MNTKIIKYLTAAAAAISITFATAFAAPLDSFTIDSVNKTMTLSGTIEGAKKYDDIQISLLKPGQVASGTDTPAAVKGKYILFTQVLADENGGYSVTVDMSGVSEADFYPMMVNGTETDTKVFFCLPLHVTNLLNELKQIVDDADKTDAQKILDIEEKMDFNNEYSRAVGTFALSDPAIKLCTSTSGLSEAILNVMRTEPTINEQNIANVICRAAYLELINEGGANIENYFAALDLNDYTAYVTQYEALRDSAELPDFTASGFTTDYFKGKKYYTRTAVDNAFKKSVRIASLKAVTSWGNIENYITTFGADSAVDMSGYEGLTTDNKAVLYETLLTTSFTDDVVFKQTANTEIARLLGLQNGGSADNSYHGGSGGGIGITGGGGGGAATTIQPIVTPPEKGDIVEFDDLDGYGWATESITYLAEKGIVNGTGDGHFAPEKNVTREEFLTMLLRALNIPVTASASESFTDADQTAWYAGYVNAAVSNGIVNGITDELFGIGRNITREDAAVLVFRAAGMTAVSNAEAFADNADIALYAYDAVYAMKNSGILNGKGDNQFAPKDSCTRAEAAKIIYSLLNWKGVR